MNRNIYALDILNKLLKLDLHKLKQFVYIICAEIGLQTFHATSDEISVYNQTA